MSPVLPRPKLVDREHVLLLKRLETSGCGLGISLRRHRGRRRCNDRLQRRRARHIEGLWPVSLVMDSEHQPVVVGLFLNIFPVRRVSHERSAVGYGATLVLPTSWSGEKEVVPTPAAFCFRNLLPSSANEKREKFPSRACRRYVKSSVSRTIKRKIARKSAVTSIRITIMGSISLFASPWPPTWLSG